MTESRMDGPLGWLPESQASRQAGVGLWQPFEERLAQTLGALSDGSFMICEVWSRTHEGQTNRKYLQYALLVSEAGRELTAEASALRYQLTVDDNASAQEALIDSMGWRRLDESSNHGRRFPWPLEISDAVADSLRILRDVWRVQHPSQVTFKDVDSFERHVVPDGLSPQRILSLTATWLAYMGAVTEPLGDLDTEIRGTLDGVEVLLGIDASGEFMELAMRVGDGALRGRDDTAILDAVGQAALAGRPSFSAELSGGLALNLDNSIPVHGLTREAFVSHVSRLITSVVAVRQQLMGLGLLA